MSVILHKYMTELITDVGWETGFFLFIYMMETCSKGVRRCDGWVDSYLYPPLQPDDHCLWSYDSLFRISQKCSLRRFLFNHSNNKVFNWNYIWNIENMRQLLPPLVKPLTNQTKLLEFRANCKC